MSKQRLCYEGMSLVASLHNHQVAARRLLEQGLRKRVVMTNQLPPTLNNGPRVVQAVQTLNGIFRRMHQHRKSAKLRSLHVAQLLPEPDAARQ